MKTLIAYYSRTDNTKKLAEKIAKELKADIDEIQDEKDRSGWIGAFIGGFDSLFKIKTPIENKKDPEKYDLIILGTPVWAGKMTPAIRTYFCKYEFKNIAFFSTSESEETKQFTEMTLLSKKPITTLSIKKSAINSNETNKKINELIHQLKQIK